jgi:hypothetical protein
MMVNAGKGKIIVPISLQNQCKYACATGGNLFPIYSRQECGGSAVSRTTFGFAGATLD